MILFFDTETTGLPDYRMPPDHPSQPYLVQLACLLMDADGRERANLNIVVNPGVPIPAGASGVHGISDRVAKDYGLPPARAIALWHELASRASWLVAHNLKFDMAIMATAWARVGSKTRPTLEAEHGKRLQVCTMEMAAPVVNLPPTDRMVAKGIMKPKPPRLEECIAHFFGESLDGAHDALVDVRACARLYYYLKARTQAATEQPA